MPAQKRWLEGEDLFHHQTASLLLLTVKGTESQALPKRRDIFLQGYHRDHVIQVLSVSYCDGTISASHARSVFS